MSGVQLLGQIRLAYIPCFSCFFQPGSDHFEFFAHAYPPFRISTLGFFILKRIRLFMACSPAVPATRGRSYRILPWQRREASQRIAVSGMISYNKRTFCAMDCRYKRYTGSLFFGISCSHPVLFCRNQERGYYRCRKSCGILIYYTEITMILLSFCRVHCWFYMVVRIYVYMDLL